MKTQEQQKAELCDVFFSKIITCQMDDKAIIELIANCSLDYEKITAQKPLTADPYADEIFSGRLLNSLSGFLRQLNKPRLSDLPNVNLFLDLHGFGRKSREEYIEVMKKYEMWDKI
tara:strand:- start:22164 stop:22511 length:348 start_codon:yes stop_codon:yes gene_type:complete